MNTLNKQLNLLLAGNKNLKHFITNDICSNIKEHGDYLINILQVVFKMVTGTNEDRNLGTMILGRIVSEFFVTSFDSCINMSNVKDLEDNKCGIYNKNSKNNKFGIDKGNDINIFNYNLSSSTNNINVNNTNHIDSNENSGTIYISKELCFNNKTELFDYLEKEYTPLGSTGKKYTEVNKDIASQKKEVQKEVGIDDRIMQIDFVESKDLSLVQDNKDGKGILRNSNVKQQVVVSNEDQPKSRREMLALKRKAKTLTKKDTPQDEQKGIVNINDFFMQIYGLLLSKEWQKRVGALSVYISILKDKIEEMFDNDYISFKELKEIYENVEISCSGVDNDKSICYNLDNHGKVSCTNIECINYLYPGDKDGSVDINKAIGGEFVDSGTSLESENQLNTDYQVTEINRMINTTNANCQIVKSDKSSDIEYINSFNKNRPPFDELKLCDNCIKVNAIYKKNKFDETPNLCVKPLKNSNTAINKKRCINEESIDRPHKSERASPNAIFYKIPDDLILKVMIILYCDKLSDFTSDQISLPVREKAADLFSLLFYKKYVRYLIYGDKVGETIDTVDSINNIISTRIKDSKYFILKGTGNILLETLLLFLDSSDWQVQCSGLLCFQKIIQSYFVLHKSNSNIINSSNINIINTSNIIYDGNNTNNDILVFDKKFQNILVDKLTDMLVSTDEDVKFISAGILCNFNHIKKSKVMHNCWLSISNSEDIAIGKKNILKLIVKIYSFDSNISTSSNTSIEKINKNTRDNVDVIDKTTNNICNIMCNANDSNNNDYKDNNNVMNNIINESKRDTNANILDNISSNKILLNKNIHKVFALFRSPLVDVRLTVYEMINQVFMDLNYDNQLLSLQHLIEAIILEDKDELRNKAFKFFVTLSIQILSNIDKIYKNDSKDSNKYSSLDHTLLNKKLFVQKLYSNIEDLHKSMLFYINSVSVSTEKGYDMQNFMDQSDNLLFTDSGCKLVGKNEVLKGRFILCKSFIDVLYIIDYNINNSIKYQYNKNNIGIGNYIYSKSNTNVNNNCIKSIIDHLNDDNTNIIKIMSFFNNIINSSNNISTHSDSPNILPHNIILDKLNLKKEIIPIETYISALNSNSSYKILFYSILFSTHVELSCKNGKYEDILLLYKN
ncbi:hypothetical protein EDEG_01331 [Edhazardia aedis USNM 41457]|uniref:Uncharacterized protein n=1 Tax=Edhazardia aedis (strain USNM 41457) TaxID=1003232 RepID=J9D9L5_EDHAE|nr:hypothetical protein EDEG_01331 [Edhazardia aedis USNM 41457]|eukprot:EJW04461.1 hypothetical protein EDEG_01331 [Edhazardia aedis USNM 41457]